MSSLSRTLLLASVLSPVRDKPANSPQGLLVIAPLFPKVGVQIFFSSLVARPFLLINKGV